jgi:enolase
MPITKLIARQILDSRGNPTLEVDAQSTQRTKGHVLTARAEVPSGASTGKHEALELRDHTKAYDGKGVQKAIRNVEKIFKKVKGESPSYQKKIDNAMITMDGTPNKSKLGANAMLGVSLAVAKLAALEKNIPLHQHLAQLAGNTQKSKKTFTLPLPFSNVINGGKHAEGDLAFQEFMIVPVKAKSFAQATQMVAETYHVLKKDLANQYGKQSTHVGDEGGFAPPLERAEQALDIIEQAISDAGYTNKIKIALDAAASSFYKKKNYLLPHPLSRGEMVDYYLQLLKEYPIISLEDPFAEDDVTSWQELMKKTKGKVQVVGDDLLVTHVKRVQMALQKKLCNSLLLKVNQIGTVTEALDAANLAFKNKWSVMVSHRSGETCDTFIADLSVGLGCGQIKLGAPCRGERTAKFNQLLRIEEELGKKGKLMVWK